MAPEDIGLSNGLAMEGDVRIKPFLGNLHCTVAHRRKSARSGPEGGSDEFIFSCLCSVG